MHTALDLYINRKWNETPTHPAQNKRKERNVKKEKCTNNDNKNQVGRGVASGVGAADSKHIAETALYETSPLAWDASAEDLRRALVALGCVGSDLSVSRTNLTYPHGYETYGISSHYGFTYEVTFMFFSEHCNQISLSLSLSLSLPHT